MMPRSNTETNPLFTGKAATELQASDLTIVGHTDAADALPEAPHITTVAGLTFNKQDAIQVKDDITIDGLLLPAGLYYFPTDTASADVSELRKLFSASESTVFITDAYLGGLAHVEPDNAKGIYLCDGQTINDQPLFDHLTAKPLANFVLTGVDGIRTADLRGRYLGASNGRGINAISGQSYSSVNKSHKHNIYTGNGASIYASNGVSGMKNGDNNWQNTRSWANANVLVYEGSTYGRPETVGMPLCIIGSR